MSYRDREDREEARGAKEACARAWPREERRPVPRLDCASFERAARRDPSLLRRSPYVLTDFVEAWGDVSSWRDLDRLAARFGQEKVEACAPQFTTNVHQDICRVRTTYGNYLDYVRDPSRVREIYDGDWVDGGPERLEDLPSPLYCGSLNIVRDRRSPVFEELVPIVPPGVENWNDHVPYFYTLFNHFWLLVSLPGAITPLHADNNAITAYIAQLRGRKKAVLFAPEDRAAYYKKGVGYLDPSCPDPDLFPRHRDAACWEAVVEEGETLIFGPDWAHHVETLETSVSISFDVVNGTNVEAYAASPQWAEEFGRRVRKRLRQRGAGGGSGPSAAEAASDLALGRRYLRDALVGQGPTTPEAEPVRSAMISVLDGLV